MGGGKQEKRKEAISRVVHCQLGKGKTWLHWGYQLDAHMLPRVSSAEWSRQEPESSELKLAAPWFLCSLYFLPLQRPPQNDTGLPQNRSKGNTLQCITEQGAVETPGPPASADRMEQSVTVRCYRAFVCAKVQRPELGDEAEAQVFTQCPAVPLLSFLFTRARNPRCSVTVSLPFFLCCPLEFLP